MSLSSSKSNTLKYRGPVKIHKFRGADLFHNFIDDVLDNHEIVTVYFDPDVDGAFAGFLICQFLEKRGIQYRTCINSNRSHGWEMPIEKAKGTYIIAVDFMITTDIIKSLCSVGCKIVSIDHHSRGNEEFVYIENNEENGLGVVINNQYYFEDEDSKYLSGAGMVYEVVSSEFEGYFGELHQALVGITLLSDVRNIENLLAEAYLYKLYTAKYEGYIKYLIDSTLGEKDLGFGVPKMDRSFVDYTFSPALNACFRFNEEKSVINWLFNCGYIDINLREQQKSLVNKIKSCAIVKELESSRVVIFRSEDVGQCESVLSNFVGLVASKYLDLGKSVVCYLIQDNKLKRTSFRGIINGLDYRSVIESGCSSIEDVQNLRSILEDGESWCCVGHGSAFGIKGLLPTTEFFNKINSIVGSLESECGYERPIVNVLNMSFFNSGKAYSIAEENMYKLSQNQTYVRYTGHNITIGRRYSNCIQYNLDGIPVILFGSTEFQGNKLPLIIPTLERGFLKYYFK